MAKLPDIAHRTTVCKSTARRVLDLPGGKNWDTIDVIPLHDDPQPGTASMPRAALLAALFLLIGGQPTWAANWPQFRGPDGQGHSTATGVPLTWSESENIAWKTALSGLGWSSPSVDGKQVWLTSALDDGKSLRAIAVDRARGNILHDVEIFKLEAPGSIHTLNSHASPTPVIEGDRVYVHYGAHGTACLSTDGDVIWKTQALKYNHQHGPGGSPVVWRDLLIINCDGTDVQYVVALDKATGEIRWKHERRHIGDDRKTGKSEVPMAYCTPLLCEIDGRTQLVSLGSDEIVGQDPATGKEFWWFTFDGYSNVSKPVFDRGRLYFASGFGKPIFYAIQAGGSGDVTETAKQWSTAKPGVVPLDVSPLVMGDELLTISDPGIAVCYDAQSGKPHWQQRLGGKFWSSPVAADGRVYCVAEDATTIVLAQGPKFETLATNKLDGRAQASPAIVDATIFLRTDTHLYRIEKQ
jgi:outer membrane protein assembly factor BamB